MLSHRFSIWLFLIVKFVLYFWSFEPKCNFDIVLLYNLVIISSDDCLYVYVNVKT